MARNRVANSVADSSPAPARIRFGERIVDEANEVLAAAAGRAFFRSAFP